MKLTQLYGMTASKTECPRLDQILAPGRIQHFHSGRRKRRRVTDPHHWLASLAEVAITGVFYSESGRALGISVAEPPLGASRLQGGYSQQTVYDPYPN